MRSSVLLLLALTTPALAVAPSDIALPDQVDGRVHAFTGAGQATARATATWQEFLAGDGAGWTARFDEITQAPLRAYGPPIPMGTVNSAESASDAVRVFLSRHPMLAGTDAKSLEVISANYNPVNDAWYVDAQQFVDRVPVEEALVTFRIKNNRLVLFGSMAAPTPVGSGVPQVRPQDAVDIAIFDGAVPDASHDIVATELVYLPVLLDGGLQTRLTYRVQTETWAPRGMWVTWIDAEDGRILRAQDDVKRITGSVSAEHDTRTVNGEFSQSPLPNIRLMSSPSSFADEDGAYDLPGQELIDGDLRGRYFRVTNEDGDNASFTVNGGELLLTEDDAHIAELDAYVFSHRVRDWGQVWAPEVDQGVMNVRVNIDDSCNAWYDGDINFLQSSRDCNNTARVSDIVYHEWGHGFHGESLLAGTWDGSMGEGIGDTVASLITGDSRIGPYFLTNGGAVRNVSPNRVYPEDYTASPEAVHSNGLIFGTAMWDLWGELIAVHGAEEGTRRNTDIFTGLVKGGPTLETVFAEALFADDDDGDLSNGTPNQCELVQVFGAHGLVGIQGAGPVSAQHAPVRDAVADEPVTLDVDVVNTAPECLRFEPQQATVTYRINGGDWEEAGLDVSVDAATGAIPAQPLGTFIEYYVTVIDAGGDALQTPADGYIHPFSLYVGDVLPVYFTDFEDDDGGFTSELVEGEAIEGANDWQHGRPGGLGGDPVAAASGTNIWGNDRSPEANWDGRYQDNRFNRLSSPALNTAHYDGVFLQYERWLTVEDGVFDQARIRADGDVVWSNFEGNDTEHHVDRQWKPHTVDLGDAAADGEVIVSWEIQSDGGLTFGGWNIDDVSLFAPNTPDNRLGISDLLVDASEDGRDAVLTWTNPVHAPLQDVIVVRSGGGLPEGPDDGTIVATLTDVAVGETVEFIDERPGRRRTFGYAVYPSDGTDVLSWTRDGLNAQTIRLADADGGAGGCGCTTTSSPMSWAWLLGLGGLFIRRRRS